ncbi:hypothetical protein CAEBREN_24643 [Caenorhabditis brenneri]|uniref:Uncharacterized protein n=1 Tax=Caenorhabditis brenneri TaxID=135651 RepID=G0MYZ5_CAEBE|nr:hypothetical protein CAEBREN_24643 [Caenorhabditis brenneri]
MSETLSRLLMITAGTLYPAYKSYKWVHPTLNQHEKEIDALMESAKSKSYNQMVRIGSQSLVYARDVVSEAAIRGQQQLVSQLQRSYSANDVGSEREVISKRIDVQKIEELDENSDSEQHALQKSPRARRRVASRSRSRSRTLESTGGADSEFAATIPRRSARKPIH